MKIKITTYNDAGTELISRDFKANNDSNNFEDEILYDIVNDSIEKLCDICEGSGKFEILARGDGGNFVTDHYEDCVCIKNITE